MKGIDAAWPSVQRQYFQGQFKRTEHKLCICNFNKVTSMKETWEHDTKPRMSSVQLAMLGRQRKWLTPLFSQFRALYEFILNNCRVVKNICYKTSY